jgi:hypothetical protein
MATTENKPRTYFPATRKQMYLRKDFYGAQEQGAGGEWFDKLATPPP